MSDVVAAIEKVRQVAQASGKGLQEANAIHKLIMPVLKALGWDVDDIEHEYACKGGGAVDIALMLGGKPRVMVEAKAYSPGASPSAADKNALQAITYGNAEGVEWCLLTNGGKYELYNTTVSLPLNEKLVLAVDVMAGTAEEVAKRLGLLSLENVSNGQLDQEGPRLLVESRLRQWLRDADEELAEFIGKQLKGKVSADAVKAGMKAVGGGKGVGATVGAQVVGTVAPEKPKSPPPSSQHETWGVLSRTRPIWHSTDKIVMCRWVDGDAAAPSGHAWVVAVEFPKLVAAAFTLRGAGKLLYTRRLAEEAFGKMHGYEWAAALETLGLLHCLGAIAHDHGVNPQYFRLVDGMTEDKIMALLAQALEEDKDKAAPQ